MTIFALAKKHQIKASVTLWGMLALMFSNSAFALNVGDIRVESYLEQPFKAVVPLIDADANDLHSLKVDIASNRAFQLAGLEYSEVLSTLRIRVDRAKGSVYLFTVQPLNEPLLMLLLDYQWQSGRIVREHTVFLDPEGFNPTGVARVETPVISAPEPAAAPTVEATDYSLPAEYGPVGNGESLSGIATKLAKGTPLTSAQVMMALYEANPTAFYKKNITALKRGATLLVPAASEIQQREAAAMLSIVSDHLKAWADGQREVASQVVAVTQSIPVADSTVPVNQEPSAELAEQENLRSTSPSSPDEAQTLSNVARNNPRLELVPETFSQDEPTSVGESGDAEASNILSGEGGGEGAGVSSAKTVQPSNPTAVEAPVNNQPLLQLERENALLRERLEQADAVVKELKQLYTVNSEQLAKLNEELARMNTQALQSSQTMQAGAEQNSAIQPRWLIWVVIALLLLLVVLLIVLLIVLLRRRSEQRDFADNNFDELAPIPAMTVDPVLLAAEEPEYAPELADDELDESDVITAPVVVADFEASSTPEGEAGYHVEEVDYAKMEALLGGSADDVSLEENLAVVAAENLDDEAPLSGDEPRLDQQQSGEPELLDIDAFLAENSSAEPEEAAEENTVPENEQSISGEDSLATNLDLARAYMDMGNEAEAKELIQSVMDSDNDVLKAEAQQLLQQLT